MAKSVFTLWLRPVDRRECLFCLLIGVVGLVVEVGHHKVKNIFWLCGHIGFFLLPSVMSHRIPQSIFKG